MRAATAKASPLNQLSPQGWKARKTSYDELSDKWERKVARAYVQEAKDKLMEEFGRGEGAARLEALRDALSVPRRDPATRKRGGREEVGCLTLSRKLRFGATGARCSGEWAHQEDA